MEDASEKWDLQDPLTCSDALSPSSLLLCFEVYDVQILPLSILTYAPHTSSLPPLYTDLTPKELKTENMAAVEASQVNAENWKLSSGFNGTHELCVRNSFPCT